MKSPKFIVVDLFCGLGGTTEGFVRAVKDGVALAQVIAAINHDPVQIKSHWSEHPDVTHFEEDIRSLDLTELVKLVEKYRKLYPSAKVILWASLECTNFSKAKGGQARDADSRTLAHSLHMKWDATKEATDEYLNQYVPGDSYIQLLKPDYIQIENVVEFMGWGPTAPDGLPYYSRNGEYFKRWCDDINKLGYTNEWTTMNSADFGAHTRRDRLFGYFSATGLPRIWPKPTHHKTGNGLPKWKPVKEVLNFDNKGVSIFNRKKPLSEPSLGRIYKGLLKFVAKGDTSFLQHYYTSGGNISSVNDSGPTIPTHDRFGLMQVEYFIYRAFTGGGSHQSIEEPGGSLTVKPKMDLVAAEPFILNPSHGGHASSIGEPCVVVVARQDKAPLYLIQSEQGYMVVPVYRGDSPMTIKIKQFMAVYGIKDITMRMLEITELLEIQGFNRNRKMVGTQAEQKKGIGNSVVPHVVEAWTRAKAEIC